MRYIYLSILCLIITVSSQAQSFTYSPSQHLMDTVMIDGPYSKDIYIANEDTTDITYKWITVSNDIPESWFTSLCDWPNCFAGIPDSGTMNTITVQEADSGIQGFFKLTLSAKTVDTVTVEIYVYDQADFNRGDTVSFGILVIPDTTGDPTGIDSKATGSFAVFPNPAADQLTVTGNDITSISIYDITGSMIREERLDSQKQVNLDISALNRGNYLLRIESLEGSTFKTIVKH